MRAHTPAFVPSLSLPASGATGHCGGLPLTRAHPALHPDGPLEWNVDNALALPWPDNVQGLAELVLDKGNPAQLNLQRRERCSLDKVEEVLPAVRRRERDGDDGSADRSVAVCVCTCVMQLRAVR